MTVLIDGAKQPHNNPFVVPLERNIPGSKVNDHILAFSYDCSTTNTEKQREVNKGRLEGAILH